MKTNENNFDLVDVETLRLGDHFIDGKKDATEAKETKEILTEVNELAETLDKIIHRTTVRYFKKPVERKPQAQAQAHTHAQHLEVPPARGDMITSPSYQSPDNLSAVKPSTIDQHQSSNSRRSSIHDRPAGIDRKSVV